VAYHGLDVEVFARCYAALSLWLCGTPAQALAQGHAARTRAQELSHPYSLAFALALTTFLHHWRRDVPAMRTGAETVLAICAEHGFGQYGSYGRLVHGWRLVAQGQGDEGLDQMRQGLTAYQARATSWLPYFLALLAEGYGQVGAADQGLHVLAEAFTMVQHTGERVWEAELHRLKGELLLQAGLQHPAPGHDVAHTAVAEACFQQALVVACRHQARALKLRAAISLSRLWQQQGKHAEARALLAPIYGWFTEGFDTADLQDAKALVAALA
jgi:predicted ATPase